MIGKKDKIMTTLADLPVDIFDEIFPLLYNGDVFNLLLTCKQITFSKHLINLRKWQTCCMSQLARDGDLQGVQYCNFKDPDYAGRTDNALSAASAHGRLNIIEFLYSAGVVAQSSHTRLAAENGHLNVVEYYYEKGVPVSPFALEIACMYGHLNVVEYYCRKGVPVNRYALNFACQNDHLHIVQVLLGTGIKLHENSLKYARESGNGQLIQYLESLQPF